jgi:hypothetical protein
MAGAQGGKDPAKADKPKSAAEQFKALQDAFNKASDDLETAYQEAAGDAERKKLVAEFRKKQQQFVRQSLALAQKFPKDAVAVDALVFVITLGRAAAEVDKAADILAKDHAAGNKAADICPAMAQSVHGEKVLRAILEKNTSNDTRGVGTLYLGMHLKGIADMIQVLRRPADLVDKDMASLEAEIIKDLKARDAGKLRAEADKLFLRVKAQYGDITLGDSKLKDLAEEELYQLRYLSLGAKAQEITGEDIEGKKLKLSDFKGKVVVLDFWGTY